MPSLQKTFDCDHPVALVTGSGAPRVGRTIATHMARLGCHLALHANASVDQAEGVAADLMQTHGIDVIVTRGSLADDSVPQQIVDQTRDRFGRLDILVNSAAVWSPTRIDEITAEEIRSYFEINALATFLCARSAATHMADQTTGGSIVNLGDWATVRPYPRSRGLLPQQRRGRSDDAVARCRVGSEESQDPCQLRSAGPRPSCRRNRRRGEADRIARSTLVGRVGTPEHVAHAVQFFL